MPNEPLPLLTGFVACINSGYCCRQGPCPFGSWDAKKGQCAELTDDNLCARYDEILAMPKFMWDWAPAFGGGCCSPGNPDRRRMLAQRRHDAHRQQHTKEQGSL